MNAGARLVVLGLLSACTSPPAVVVQIDASPLVRSALVSIDVVVAGGARAPDTFGLPVGNEPPDCLPIYFGVTRDAADTVSATVRGTLRSGRSFERRVEVEYGDGLRLLELELDDSCLEDVGCRPADAVTVPITDDDAEARIRGRTCHVLRAPNACVEGGGCFVTRDRFTPLCVESCPVPTIPEHPDPPMPPAPPMPPVFLPCPAGWVVASGETDVCVPWIAGATCDEDAYRFPGDSDCHPLDACGRTWPDDLPSTTLYVRPGARGDGSEASPFSTIAEAVSAAASGTTIALAVGTHDVPATVVVQDLALRGACAMRTRVTGPPRSTLLTLGGSSSAQGFTLAGDLEATGATKLTALVVEGVVVGSGDGITATDIVTGGLRLTGARATFTRTRIDGPLVSLDAETQLTDFVVDGSLFVDASSRLALDHGVVERGAGLDTDGAVTLDRVVFRDLTTGAVHVGAGVATLATVAMLRLPEFGVRTAAGELTLTDLAVEHVSPTPVHGGTALFIEDTTLDAARVAVFRSGSHGVRLERATASIADLRVVAPQGYADGTVGIGLWSNTSSLTLARAAIEDASRYGALLDRGTATIEDLRVARTRADRLNRDRGSGVVAYRGVDAKITRAAIERNLDSGIWARADASDGVTLELVDVDVSDTSTSGDTSLDADRGYGLRVGTSPSDPLIRVFVVRGRFSRNRGANIFTLSGETDLEHVSMTDGRQTLGASKLGGYGLRVDTGSTVTGRFVSAVNNRDVGLILHGPASTVRLTDVRVEGTTEPQDTPGPNLAGAGIASGFEADVEVVDFYIADNTGGGVLVYQNGGLDLERGLVERNGTGALIRQPGYDVQRVAAGVLYRDNGGNLLTSE